jgi:hypothetical protein
MNSAPDKVPPFPSLNEARIEALKATSPAQIQLMDKQALLKLQRTLMLGGIWGVIEFPAQWMPPGMLSQNSARTIVLFPKMGQTHEANTHVAMQLTRYVLLCMLTPFSTGRTRKYLQPSSICAIARRACKLAERALLAPPLEDETALFGRLDMNDKILGKRDRIEMQRMHSGREKGLWMDVPKPVVRSLPRREPVVSVDDDAPAVATANMPTQEEKPEDPYMPLSDKFVAAAGWRFTKQLLL